MCVCWSVSYRFGIGIVLKMCFSQKMLKRTLIVSCERSFNCIVSYENSLVVMNTFWYINVRCNRVRSEYIVTGPSGF